MVLPAGFAASDGFIQRATVSAPDYFREYELPTLDGSTRIAVPPVLELVLTLSLGFCRIDTKDICYLDWTELSVSRDPALDRTRNVELRYLPEDPS